MSEKVPPVNIEAERAVLGCAMLDMDGALRAVQALEVDDFYRKQHRLIFGAISEVATRGEYPDYILVSDALGVNLEEAGGREAIFALASSEVSSVNVEQYADLVKQASLRRGVIEVATRALRDAEAEDIVEVQADMQRGLQAVSSSDRQWMTTEQVLAVPENTEHFLTGLKHLDDLTGGIRAGVTLIGGKPGAGKSTLALQIILRALEAGHSAGMIGADQLRSDQARIIWSQMAKATIENLRAYKEWEKDYAKMLAFPLLWYTGRVSLGAVCAAIRTQSAQGRNFYVVDSLQMIRVPGSAQKSEKTDEAAQEIKRVAHECSVFVLLMSEGTKQYGVDATLESFRGGQPVTHAADLALWLEPVPQEGIGPRQVRARVLKNKLGYSDQQEVLTFDGRLHRFTDE
jgi:replicative DNA helicase